MPDTPDSYEGPARDGRKRFSNPTSVRHFFSGQHGVTMSGTTMSGAELSSGVRIKASGLEIFIGGSDVTTLNGYSLQDGGEVFIDIDSMNKVFVVAGATGGTAEFLAS
tara:strand:+ start:282 stop:605 length:324 start_codon:yes stop_codon:yes gene_type:complete